MRNERLTILVTPTERASIAARAKALGVSNSEMLRLAFDAYEEAAPRQELEILAEALERTVADIRRSLDEARHEVAVTLAEFHAGRKDAA